MAFKRKNWVFTRRNLLAGAAALPFFNECAVAIETGPADEDFVRIGSNENPLGPCREGLDAMAKVGPFGGRYSPFNLQREFVKAVAEAEGLKEDHVAAFAGSSDPLYRAACAFTSPGRSWTMADPSYGGGPLSLRVPLRADYSHDVQAMIRRGANTGAYYICNPNNPTGTLTPRKDIDYLLAKKQKDAVVVVDEAYIHYSVNAQPCNNLVAAGRDVVILRTFSKVYGMAGIRAGYALGRPDLLLRMRQYGVSAIPVTALACAIASLKVKTLIPERREINRRVREDTFEFLEKKGVKYIPSEVNYFMMDAGRPGVEFAKAMAAQKVIVGRVWPRWPTKVRVTVGTQDEMDKFKAAFEKVWS